MITYEVLSEIVNELESNEVIQINYDGFTGRGINGVMNKSMRICGAEKTDSIVKQYRESNTEYKTEMLALILHKDYVLATYTDYGKRYEDWIIQKEEYTIIVPYESIQSMEIYRNSYK